MIYVDSFQVQDIYVDSFHNPDIYVDSFKTFPNGEVRKWISNEAGKYGIRYQNGGNAISASGGSDDYAVFWGTVVTDDGVTQSEYRIEFTPVFWNNSGNISMWHINGTHIWADNRGTTTGSTRSVNVTGLYDLDGDGTPEEYALYGTVSQEANRLLYDPGEIEYIYFNGSPYSVNGSTLTLNNIGSEPASYNLSASGYRWYRYTSWGDSGWRKMTTLPTDVVVSGVKDGNNWVWNITEGSGFASLYNDGSSLILNVEWNQSTSSTRKISLTVEDPKYSDTRVTASTIQNADNYTLKLYDGTPNPYMVEYNDTTTYVYIVSKEGSSRKLIKVNNVSVTYNGAMLTAGTVSDYSSSMGEGVYRLSFTGAANNTNSERESTVTVTQPTSYKTINFKIKQAIQGQFHNGIQIISSITVGTDTWLAGTILLDDGFYAAVVVCKNGTPAHTVKVTISEVQWTDENGSHTDSTIYNIDTGDTITCDTYYAGEQTYKGTDLLDDYTFRHVENLTITRLNISIERADVYTNITVSYYNNDGSTASGDYVPAAGGYALIKGYQGAQQSVMMPTLKQGTDTNVWSVDSSGKIMAGSRGTVTGNVLTAVTIVNDGTQNLEYTVTQQANSKSNTVSPGEIEWARVNSDVIYNGDTVSIDNFANTLNITQVSGYRKQYYTSGSFDRVSMLNLNNDFRVTTQYGETWISTGTTKFEILVSANTSQISSRSATVTIDDANGYSTNPTLIFTVEQAADSWIFSLYDSNTKSIDYNETTFEINVYSKYNNSPYPIDTSLISFSSPNAVGITAGTVTLVNQNTGQYKISFTCGQNSGNNNLTTTITILQNGYTGANRVSVAVTQYKQLTNEVKLNINGGMPSTGAAKYAFKFDVLYNGTSIYGITNDLQQQTFVNTAITFTLPQSPIYVTYQGQMLTYNNVTDQTPSGAVPLTFAPDGTTMSNGGEYTTNCYSSSS